MHGKFIKINHFKHCFFSLNLASLNTGNIRDEIVSLSTYCYILARENIPNSISIQSYTFWLLPIFQPHLCKCFFFFTFAYNSNVICDKIIHLVDMFPRAFHIFFSCEIRCLFIQCQFSIIARKIFTFYFLFNINLH